MHLEALTPASPPSDFSLHMMDMGFPGQQGETQLHHLTAFQKQFLDEGLAKL